MIGTYSVDALIRAGLREEVVGQEPSASVRDSLLAASSARTRGARHLAPRFRLWSAACEIPTRIRRRCSAGGKRGGRTAVIFRCGIIPGTTPGLVHVMVYYDARRCRFERVTC